VAPPGGRSAQAHQAGGLGGDAVGGHELLLLADGAEEADGVRAEADQPDHCEREQAERRARQHAHAFARARRRECEERQQQRRGDLHADAGRERHRGAAVVAAERAHAGAQQQRKRQHEQHQRVVVGAAHGQREQHRVQADERGRPASGAPEAAGGRRDQRDRRQAGKRGERFEDPHTGGRAQGCDGVAAQREQGSVGGVLERPAEELEDGIGGRFGGEVGVGVQAVQRAHATVGQIAEDVLGEQRRPQHEDHVGGHDARHEGARGQRSRAREHERVAAAHDQHERLETFAGQTQVKARERTRQPAWPAPAAGRHEAARLARRAPGEQQRAGEHTEQAERGQRAQRARGNACAGGAAPRRRRGLGEAGARYWRGGLHEPIVTSPSLQSSIRPASL